MNFQGVPLETKDFVVATLAIITCQICTFKTKFINDFFSSNPIIIVNHNTFNVKFQKAQNFHPSFNYHLECCMYPYDKRNLCKELEKNES